MPAHLHIGIDTGGTFTDLVAWDGISFRTAKVPSTPPDFHRGVIAALSEILHPGDTAELIHGSTVATNALLERRGEPIAFITTGGFADLLLIGRQNRPVLYALEPRRAPPIVADDHVFTVDERIAVDGWVLTPLAEDQVKQVIEKIKSLGIRDVAVCLLFSFVNPAHEQTIGRLCTAAELTVTLSSDLLPEFREYERASVTAINAALRPTVQHYLDALSVSLPPQVRSLRIMHSGGGTLPPTDAGKSAARLLLSGPAGGVLGANAIAQLEGLSHCITYDMGGTSTDVSAIVDGKPPWTNRTTIDGLPVPLAMFDIHTIGAGGGSIASVDIGGALTVGPRSAGANPGPACYGRGGMLPTVTDANLILGRLPAGRFLGGRMALHRESAEAALTVLAQQMGKSLIDTALGILRIAESNMSAAIRQVTAGRGHDPRKFTLVCFGGAGGLHAAALADSLEIPRVLIPPHAGLLSAFGMVVAPPLADVSRTVAHLGGNLSEQQLSQAYAELAIRAGAQLPVDQTLSIERFADCRFRGQSHELTITVNKASPLAIEREFRSAYQAMYGQCPQGREVEIVTLRLRHRGRPLSLKITPEKSSRVMKSEIVEAILPDARPEKIPLYDRPGVAMMGIIHGPAIIADADATAWVPAGWSARITVIGGVVLERCDAGTILF